MERYKLFKGYISHSMRTALTYYLEDAGKD